MQDFEKLGVFYLGRLYDIHNKSELEDLLLYDSRDLVTHAVCIVMTGSARSLSITISLFLSSRPNAPRRCPWTGKPSTPPDA